MKNMEEIKINKVVKKLLLKRIEDTYFIDFNDFINFRICEQQYCFNNEYKELINNDTILINDKTKKLIELLIKNSDINSLIMSMIEF